MRRYDEDKFSAIKDGWDRQAQGFFNVSEEKGQLAALDFARKIAKNHAAYQHLYRGKVITNFCDIPIIDKNFILDNMECFCDFAGLSTVEIARYIKEFSMDNILNGHLIFQSSGSGGRKSISIYRDVDFGKTLAELYRAILQPDHANKMSYIGMIDRYNGGNQWMYHLSRKVQLQYLSYFDADIPTAESLIEFQPEVIFTKPTKLIALGKILSGMSNPLKQLKRIISVGENLNVRQAQEIQEYYGVLPQNSFSTTEVGPIGFQTDPHVRELELYTDLSYVEIVDDNDMPILVPGKTGRLVVTNFYNSAFPLIRYDLADCVSWIEGGIGRKISFIEGRSSKNLVFLQGKSVINELPLWRYDYRGIQEIQFIQMDEATLLVRYSLARRGNEQFKTEEFKSDLRSFLSNEGLDLESARLLFEPLETIPPDPNTSKIKRVEILV